MPERPRVGPGLIVVSWSLCDCPPAVAASGGGAAGHLAVYCEASPGCGRCGTGPDVSGASHQGDRRSAPELGQPISLSYPPASSSVSPAAHFPLASALSAQLP